MKQNKTPPAAQGKTNAPLSSINVPSPSLQDQKDLLKTSVAAVAQTEVGRGLITGIGNFFGIKPSLVTTKKVEEVKEVEEARKKRVFNAADAKPLTEKEVAALIVSGKPLPKDSNGDALVEAEVQKISFNTEHSTREQPFDLKVFEILNVTVPTAVDFSSLKLLDPLLLQNSTFANIKCPSNCPVVLTGSTVQEVTVTGDVPLLLITPRI